MKILKLVVVIAGVVMFLGQATVAAVAADDSAPVVGTWVDKLPDGYLMVLSFTATSVAFQPFDAGGKGGAPTTIPVKYKKQSNGDLHLTPEGDVGEPLRVTIKNPNTLELQFQGREPRTLTRQKAEAALRGH